MTESSDHIQLKMEVARLCEQLGFSSRPEGKVGSFRADVLAARGERAVAFEIQSSRQSESKTRVRQERYRLCGVAGCWLFREPRKRLTEVSDVPIFRILGDSGAYRVALLDGRREASLQEFLQAFLENGIRFCAEAKTMKKQTARIVFYEMKCWRCRAANHAYYLDEPFLSSCNFRLEEMQSLWTGDRPEFRQEILHQIPVVKANDARIRLGEIKSRWSKTANSGYLSFGCISCDSIFGDWFVNSASMEARYLDNTIPVDIEVSLNPPITLEAPHWCFPASRSFCDESRTS